MREHSINVNLTTQERDALVVASQRVLRHPRDHARYILRTALGLTNPENAFGAMGEGSIVLDPHLSIFLKPEMIRIGDHSRIDGRVKIEGGQGVTIGNYVHIATDCHLNIGGGNLVIKSHAGVSSGAEIITGSNTMDGLSMSASSPADMQVVKRSQVVIEPYAFVGVGAIILPDIVIGRGAVVGAGAVVTRYVEPYAVVVGNPARFLKWREVRP